MEILILIISTIIGAALIGALIFLAFKPAKAEKAEKYKEEPIKELAKTSAENAMTEGYQAPEFNLNIPMPEIKKSKEKQSEVAPGGYNASKPKRRKSLIEALDKAVEEKSDYKLDPRTGYYKKMPTYEDMKELYLSAVDRYHYSIYDKVRITELGTVLEIAEMDNNSIASFDKNYLFDLYYEVKNILGIQG